MMATDVIPQPSPSSLEPAKTLNSVDHSGTVSVEQMTALPGASYKNRLQEFAQKSAMPLPVYSTTNYGFSHSPRFKSTVVVDGLIFVSPKSFPRAKAAEQDVAKYALEALTQKIQEEGCPMLNVIPTLYKSILNEFAVKISVPMPTYSTKQADADTDADGMLTFISDALFCGKSYTGRGKSKKEAEQMAARVVIETILGNSCSRIVMSRIVNSKTKLSPATTAIIGGNSVISSEDQPQSDPLGEFVHQLPDGTLCEKKRNKEKKEESQPKKQRLEEQQESQKKEPPEEEQESELNERRSMEEVGPTSA